MNSSHVAYYRRWRELERNLVFISTTEFFKDNKTARARKARAVCSLWKIYKCLFTPNCTRKSRQTKFWQHAHATGNLHSCYTFVFVLHEKCNVFFSYSGDQFYFWEPFLYYFSSGTNGDFRPRWAWSLKRLSSYKVVWWWRVRLVILSHTCVHLVCQILYLSPLPLLSFLMEGR